MGAVIGDILPLALGVAISPVPVIAAILMLLSPRAKATSVGFLLGWLLGIVIAVTLFTFLSSMLPSSDSDDSDPVRGTVQIVLGVLLLLLSIREFRSRPKPGEEPKLPKWMQAIDKVDFARALGLGLLLSAVNPKNLLLAVGAGSVIGAAGLDGAETAGVIAVYTLIAACTVLVPVVGYLIAADRLRGPLDALRGWLGRENTVIMGILVLVIGVDLIGKGIAAF